jgi:hypothetical protein
MEEKTDISVGLFYLCIGVLVFISNMDWVFFFSIWIRFSFFNYACLLVFIFQLGFV